MEPRKNSSVDFNQYSQNGKYATLHEVEGISSIPFSYSNMKEKMLCFYSGETLIDEDEKPVLKRNITKNLGKKVIIIFFFTINCSYIDEVKPIYVNNIIFVLNIFLVPITIYFNIMCYNLFW